MSDRAPLFRVRGAELSALLTANLNSFALDFVARTAVGGTDLSFFIIKQLPLLPPEAFERLEATGTRASDFIIPRVLELTYTAWDLEPFARDLGYDGAPFLWHEERRFLIRCELDAAFFHLYGISRDDADYIMETFPIVKRKDVERFGEYRTKRVILEIYNEMEQAKRTGRPYQTRLDPPPGDPRAAHQPAGHEPMEEPIPTRVFVFPEPYPTAAGLVGRGAKKAPERFQQAAIFAWTVQQLYSPGLPVSRFRTGKMIYLIERALELGLFRNYLKQAAGPYDPTLRYGGAEGIAVRRLKWLVATDASHFAPGPNIKELDRYVVRYLDTAQASNVIEQFRTYRDETLERWTTVDMTARELESSGLAITPEKVWAYIESTPEWLHKLDRREFSVSHVSNTLAGLRKLGFLSNG